MRQVFVGEHFTRFDELSAGVHELVGDNTQKMPEEFHSQLPLVTQYPEEIPAADH